jgi:hypothetical protein
MELKAGEVRAETPMGSTGKDNVAYLPAGEVHSHRIGVDRRVDVRGRPDRVDGLPIPNYQAVAQVDVIRRESDPGGNGRLKSHDLFHCHRDERLSATNRSRSSGCCASQAKMQDIDDVTVSKAGEHQKEHDVDQIEVRQRFPVDIRPDQGRDEIILRFRFSATYRKKRREIFAQLRPSCRHVRVDLLQGIAGRVEDTVFELDEEVEIIDGT